MNRIQKAIDGSERIKIIYHGGSRPGAMREIIPHSIIGPKLLAHCLASGLEKTFFLNKIEIVDADHLGIDGNDDLSIIAAFGKCMEEDDGGFNTIKDVKKLPYPKEVILESFCRQFSIEKNDKLVTI